MSNFSADIFIYKYFYHQFNTAESKHFNIPGKDLLWGAFAFHGGITLRNHSFFLLKKFWMLQVRKSHFCGISASVILWVKHKLMPVSDFSDSFSRNHFLKGASLFNGWGLFFNWGTSFFSWGVPHGASILMWRVFKKIIRWKGHCSHTLTPPQLKSLLSQNSHYLNIFKPFSCSG